MGGVAHLRQSGLLVADFVFADGRQLLQRVAVVGQRSRQPRKLGPSCKTETEKTTFTKSQGRHLNPIWNRYF